MALWVARAGAHGEDEDLAVREGVVVIGWSELPDLGQVRTRAELAALLEQGYPDEGPKTITNWVGQVWAFVKRIKEGDLVALPLKRRPAIAFGWVRGPYVYRADLPPGARHCRAVQWLKEPLPRSVFDQDLLYSLGSSLTVFQVQRHNAEERIRALLKGGRLPAAPSTTENADEDLEAELDLEQYAADQIRSHIARKFAGHGLTRLVAALLEAQGYHTYVSPEGPDGGVDIIAGRGAMGFDPPRLCVQVKSSEQPVDVRVLRELQGVMGNFGAEQGLLVSWGGFKQSVLAEEPRHFFEIRLWDSDDVVSAVQESYEDLTDDIRAELPLRRLWALVPEE